MLLCRAEQDKSFVFFSAKLKQISSKNLFLSLLCPVAMPAAEMPPSHAVQLVLSTCCDTDLERSREPNKVAQKTFSDFSFFFFTQMKMPDREKQKQNQCTGRPFEVL